MQRSPRRRAWFVLCALLLGCTQVLEFDRAKIDEDAGGLGGPGGPAGGPGGPGGMGGTGGADLDGSLPDGDAPVVEAGPQCTRDSQCASNELCCMGECKKTSAALCTACDTGCSVTTADSCNNRACSCGNGPACAGGQFCVAGAGGGVSHCSECRDANDCAGRSDGKLQCADGSCVQCDPATNAGCSGDTPICNPSSRTCQPCSSSPDNCPGNLVCTSSGACGGCANAPTDCTTPTAPICDPGTTQCRACQGAVTNNAECMAQVSKPYCENQRCSVCRPSTEAGCDLSSNRPDCRLNDEGQNECQACAADAHCENAGARRFCNTASGRCAECLSSAECTDSSRPFCDTSDGTCKPCNANPGGANEDNFWCSLETLLSRPFCDATSGRCVACLNASHCGGNFPVCDATSRTCRGCSRMTEAADCPSSQAPACANNGRCVQCRQGGPRTACDPGEQCSGNSCVDCTSDDHCGNGNTPFCQNNACVACTAVQNGANARCAARSAPGDICVTTGNAAGACRACDPMDHDGCTGGQLCCITGGDPSCQGTNPSQCETCGSPCGDAQVCLTGGRQCVGCNSHEDCVGTPMTPFCTADHACVASCQNNADCTAVSPALPHCLAGVCVICDPVTNAGCTAPAMCTPTGMCM